MISQLAGPLDALPLPVFLVATLAVVCLVIEAGFRLGRRRRLSAEDEKEAPVGAIVGATLGLLGFMLAFTYGVAATRFDARRSIIVQESNIIGTAYLRAGLLEESRCQHVRLLLREYVDDRLEARRTRQIDYLLHHAGSLHRQLWAEAEAAGRRQPDSVSVGLFIQAVNDLIDMHSTRILVSLSSRIPPVFWGTLGLVTVLTMSGVGYLCGLSRSRRSPATIVLAVCFSAMIYVVADLDRPGEGLIDVSGSSMEDVRRMMTAVPRFLACQLTCPNAMPRYPALYQVNTRVWLTDLSRKQGRPATLDDIPDAELDHWVAQGFDWIWLLSVWQTGTAGRRISRANPEWRREFQETLPDLTDDDVPGSGFAITGYTVHTSLGGDAALARLRERMRQRGLKLMLDFVPNHTGLDHPWVEEHPEYFIPGTELDLARAPLKLCLGQPPDGRSAARAGPRSVLPRMARRPAAQLRRTCDAGGHDR